MKNFNTTQSLEEAIETANEIERKLKECDLKSMTDEEALKEIADLCSIKKNLTTHTGRHTFSTVVALANNVSLENVAKMLGHSNIKMTQHYARVLDSSILKDMNNVRDILSNCL